jgi:hypothetical protein
MHSDSLIPGESDEWDFSTEGNSRVAVNGYPRFPSSRISQPRFGNKIRRKVSSYAPIHPQQTLQFSRSLAPFPPGIIHDANRRLSRKNHRIILGKEERQTKLTRSSMLARCRGLPR